MTDTLQHASALSARRVRQLAHRHGTPLFVIRLQSLKKAYRHFTRSLKGVKPYYSVKTLNRPAVISTLAEMGACFDCASGAEIQSTLDIVKDPARILFANTIKKPMELEYAAAVGVNTVTADNALELDKIARAMPGANVLIRIHVANAGAVVELASKFGCDPDHALTLANAARRLRLNPIGISFHVGSQCTGADAYVAALKMARNVFEEARCNGLRFTHLDIGGGFPIRHFDSDPDIFSDMAETIQAEIAARFDRNVTIIAEPGRFIAGPSATLICSVIGKSIRNGKRCYYIDDGVYGAQSALIFDHATFEYKTLKTGARYPSVLFGPTCDAFDTLSRDILLPELHIGDIIYAGNVGAYTLAGATSFNGYAPPKVLEI